MCPSLSEQAAIARFLDHTNRRIRRYIRAQEKLVALLQEYQQVLVSNAVTGRIDVRTGKPYPAYKDSGVAWLGEVRRLKEICSQSAAYGANVPASSYTITGVRFIRTTDITEEGELTSSGVFLPKMLAQDSFLSDGDLLVSRSGTVGRSFLYNREVHGQCSYAGYLVRFRPDNRTYSKFLFLYTKTPEFMRFIKGASISSTIDNVNGRKYSNCPLPVPPQSEQVAIACFLDKMTEKLHKSIAQAQREIELLREYRTQLIADVVTGKLDVREAAAQLPEIDLSPASSGRDDHPDTCGASSAGPEDLLAEVDG